MTLLSTLVEPLKRELAVPGTFDDVFPDTDDDVLTATLADGFAEARLRGFFPDMQLTEVNGDYDTSSELSLAGTALVVIFSSMRVIRAQIRAMNTSERYKAGSTEFEIQRAATVLKGEIDFLQKRLDDIIKQAEQAARPLAIQLDNYAARVNTGFGFGRFYDYEF